ncbi:DUF948 domain-containing protein [uncultured Tessaracoccus sp.]|uniref:DUF948 domain-containing protein n=1 Tax=uncultured Tessaracoccus sp. TaxID=905023 RepID=UPI0025FF3788|nr:DUF948 domain-containing protein [uncultured Tessaracoccus sp.]
MSVGELAAILAAVALCVLVTLAARPLLRARGAIDEATESLRRASDAIVPAMHALRTAATNADANLDKLATVTDDAGRVAANAADVSEDAAQFSNLVGAVFGKPLVKTAAFTYGVRKAITGGRK